MGGFIKGDVVVLPFPFSDLSGSKRRPAFVLADLPGDDIILCQITSQESKDVYAVSLKIQDFSSGSLPSSSYIRPTRIFTADKNIIIRNAGTVNDSIISTVVKTITDLVNQK